MKPRYRAKQSVYIENHIATIYMVYQEEGCDAVYAVKYKENGKEIHRAYKESQLQDDPQMSIFDFLKEDTK